jgi:hypothetical protein
VRIARAIACKCEKCEFQVCVAAVASSDFALAERTPVAILPPPLQIRVNAVAFTIFVLATCVLWFIGGDACVNYVVTWLGMLPLLVGMTGLVLLDLYLSTPRAQSDAGRAAGCVALQQRFAWTEARLPRKVAQRAEALRALEGCCGCRTGACIDHPSFTSGSSSPGDASPSDAAAPAPMFCFETCIKLFFWAALIYDFTEADGQSPGILPESIRELLGEVGAAMRLFGLTRRRLFYDRGRGTKVLVAWSDDTILVSVRGSIERANFYEDAKARPHISHTHTMHLSIACLACLCMNCSHVAQFRRASAVQERVKAGAMF